MSWPVKEGYISERFGSHPHPVYKFEVKSNGIEITTKPGAPVRAVFGGEVMSVQIIAGTKAVNIQHGDFITVYYNLSSVSVNKGDKVSPNEQIGTVFTNPGSGKTALKFFVLQNTTFLNPQSWITQ